MTQSSSSSLPIQLFVCLAVSQLSTATCKIQSYMLSIDERMALHKFAKSNLTALELLLFWQCWASKMGEYCLEHVALTGPNSTADDFAKIELHQFCLN